MNSLYYIVNVEAAIYRDGKWLIIKRSEKEEHAPGLLSFVGGKVEVKTVQNNVLEETLKREIMEEVGIEVAEPVQYLESKSFVTDKGEVVVDVVFICKYKSGEAKCMSSEEVSEVHWMSSEEILENEAAPIWLKETMKKVQKVCENKAFRKEKFHQLNGERSYHDYTIEKGTRNHIDELENLYNELNDYLQQGTNYAGWAKGIYPIRDTALQGVQNNNLFVLKINNEIAGTIILNHEPEEAYSQGKWNIERDYEEIIVIHTLCVHPKYMKNGIGKKLMDFAEKYSIDHNMKAIRLDVSIHNTPAVALYEKCGYKYIGTVDLGLNVPGLVWFKLYEKVL